MSPRKRQVEFRPNECVREGGIDPQSFCLACSAPLCLALAQPSLLASQVASATAPSKALVEQILSWLPADTETVIGATGPLLLPAMNQAQDGTMRIAPSEDGVRGSLKQVFLLDLLRLSKDFKDEPIVMAMEGSRNFRQPSGLGMALYQGGTVAIFADDITVRANAFLHSSASRVVQTEQIEGQKVTVFKEKSEEDIWTTYVAFPKPNVVVVATDEDYLREVLARMNGKQGERALPDTLPEWNYANTQAQFWALRHFRHGGQSSLTSGFSCIMPEMKPDERAVGLAFSFDPDRSKTATVTYLSEDENTLQSIQKSLLNMREPGAREIHAQYHEVQHGALEGAYALEQVDSAQYLVFVLAGLLGHAIFI